MLEQVRCGHREPTEMKLSPINGMKLAKIAEKDGYCLLADFSVAVTLIVFRTVIT